MANNRFTPEQLIAKGYTLSSDGWIKVHFGKPAVPLNAKAPIPLAMPKATPKPPNTPTTPQKGRLRQNTSGLNKTERAFQFYLETRKSEMNAAILSQAITLKIANGCRYTPDFITVEDEPLEDAAGCAQTLYAYEVKGFMRDDAAVKLKVAASLYPWIKFHLVTRKKGEWNIQEILP